MFAIGGAAFLFLAITVFGFSLPEAGDEAVAYVGGAAFLASIGGFFGLTPILYGVAVVTGDEYPGWLGWVAILAGIVGVVTGTIIFYDGFSTLTDVVLFPIASILFTAWVGIMGYTLWQRASAPATTT